MMHGNVLKIKLLFNLLLIFRNEWLECIATVYLLSKHSKQGWLYVHLFQVVHSTIYITESSCIGNQHFIEALKHPFLLVLVGFCNGLEHELSIYQPNLRTDISHF